VNNTIITSTSNPLVQRARALRQRKGRDETGLFLVEGIHPVGSAVESGWEIDSILYTEDVLSSRFVSDFISKTSTRPQLVSPRVLESLSEKDNPQGIVAVVHKKTVGLSGVAMLNCGVAVVSPQDPGNVGTILRTLDAVAADGLFLLDGGVDPYHPTSVRASMGALFWKPIVQTSFHELVDWSHQHGIQLIATSAHAEMDYRAFKHSQRWILVLGSEQKGLDREQIGLCDATISVPMRGRSSSLNLAVAAAVLLYQFLA
jgi:RNA methyltransferase, TrmH family